MTLIFDFVYTYQVFAFLVHIFSETDDDMLPIFLFFDVVGKQSGVFVVEGSIDLIHEVEGEVFYFLAGKDER